MYLEFIIDLLKFENEDGSVNLRDIMKEFIDRVLKKIICVQYALFVQKTI